MHSFHHRGHSVFTCLSEACLQHVQNAESSLEDSGFGFLSCMDTQQLMSENLHPYVPGGP